MKKLSIIYLLISALFSCCTLNVLAADLGHQLWLAARNGDEAQARLLLQQGVDANYRKEGSRLTPLMVACLVGHSNIARLLIEAPYQERVYALLAGDNLVAQDFPPELIGRMLSPLLEIVPADHFGPMAHAARVDVNARSNNGYTALLCACNAPHEQSIELVNLLLAHGAEVNITDALQRTPLRSAIENGNVTNVRTLLQHGAQINNEGTIELNATNGPRAAAIIRLLVDAGANIDTALIKAGCTGDIELANYLLGRGANINTQAPLERMTPLFTAIQNNHLELVRFLVEHGANIEAKLDQGGNWPAHGYTPLMYAVRHGKPEIVQFLLAAGADASVKNRLNLTLLEIAHQELDPLHPYSPHFAEYTRIVNLLNPHQENAHALANPAVIHPHRSLLERAWVGIRAHRTAVAVGIVAILAAISGYTLYKYLRKRK